jgi:hypothetical protein
VATKVTHPVYGEREVNDEQLQSYLGTGWTEEDSEPEEGGGGKRKAARSGADDEKGS